MTWIVTGALLLLILAAWAALDFAFRLARAVWWTLTDNPYTRQERLVERCRRVRSW